MQHVYVVTLTNLANGEQRTLEILTDHPREAQDRALSRAFREWGWRRVEAPLPKVKEPVQG